MQSVQSIQKNMHKQISENTDLIRLVNEYENDIKMIYQKIGIVENYIFNELLSFSFKKYLCRYYARYF